MKKMWLLKNYFKQDTFSLFMISSKHNISKGLFYVSKFGDIFGTIMELVLKGVLSMKMILTLHPNTRTSNKLRRY